MGFGHAGYEEGRTAVWVGDFTEASLGPHHEVQISLLASAHPVPPLAAHPLALLHALLTRTDVRMVCHGLWNSTARVVRYNAEHLGLNAHYASGLLTRRHAHWRAPPQTQLPTALALQGPVKQTAHCPSRWAGHSTMTPLSMGGTQSRRKTTSGMWQRWLQRTRQERGGCCARVPGGRNGEGEDVRRSRAPPLRPAPRSFPPFQAGRGHAGRQHPPGMACVN